MSFLNNLVHFLEGNAQAVPQAAKAGAGVGAALGGVNQPNTQQLHAATNTIGLNQEGTGYPNSPMTVGVPQLPFTPSSGYMGLQGSAQNPGFTPLQDMRPLQLNQNPQFQGYNAGQGIQAYRHFNPQVSDTGYSWNQ